MYIDSRIIAISNSNALKAFPPYFLDIPKHIILKIFVNKLKLVKNHSVVNHFNICRGKQLKYENTVKHAPKSITVVIPM
jgi:hypothetical protein